HAQVGRGRERPRSPGAVALGKATAVGVDVQPLVDPAAGVPLVVVDAPNHRATGKASAGRIPERRLRQLPVLVAIQHVGADVAATLPRAMHGGAGGNPHLAGPKAGILAAFVRVVATVAGIIVDGVVKAVR